MQNLCNGIKTAKDEKFYKRKKNYKIKWKHNKMNILREVYLLYMCYQGKTMTGGVKTPTHMQSVWRMETDGYPKLSLHEECTLETSENDKSGIGSMGWKEAWYAWE